MAVIDHLVYFVPDLAAGIDWFEEETGLRPAIGGSHPGMRTHNALVSFGGSYLELIASDPQQPDPHQPDPAGPRPFGIDDLDAPTLVTFAARPGPNESLGELVAAMRSAGHDPGDPMPMSRRTPDGDELRWTLTLPTDRADGLIPFLIDWGDTPHPGATAPGGAHLFDVMGATPEHELANAVLRAIGLEPLASPGHGGLSAIVDGTIGTIPLVL